MFLITIPPFAVGRFFELTEIFDKMQAFSVSVGIETAMKSLEMALAAKANGFTTVVLMAASDVRDGIAYDMQPGVPPLNGHYNEFNISCNTTLPSDNTSRIIPGNCLAKDALLFMTNSDDEILKGSVDNVYPPFAGVPTAPSEHLNPPFPRWSQWMVAITGIQTTLLSTAEEPTVAFVYQPSQTGVTTPTNRPNTLQYISTSSTIEPLTKDGKLTASVRPLLRFGKFNCSGVAGEACEGFTQDLLPTTYYNAIVTNVYPDPAPSSTVRYSRSGTFDDYRLTATKDVTLLDSDFLLSVRDEGVSMVEGTTPVLSSALSFSDTGTPLLTLATNHLSYTNAGLPNAAPSYIGSMTFRLSVDGLSTLFRRAVDSIPWGEAGGTLGTEWFLVWSSSTSGGTSTTNDFVVASSVWNASNLDFTINTKVSSRREEWLLMTTRKLCFAVEGQSATPTGFFEGDALLKARVSHAGGVRASPSEYTDAYLDAPILPPKKYRCIKQVSDVPFAPLQYVYSNSAFEATIRTNSVQSFAVDWFILRSDVTWLDLEMYTFVSIAVKFGASISTNDPRISFADPSSVGIWKVLFFIPQFGSWQFVLGSVYTALLPSLFVGILTWFMLQYGLYDFVMRGVQWAKRDDADIRDVPRFIFDPQGMSHAVGVFLQDVYITIRAQPMLLLNKCDEDTTSAAAPLRSVGTLPSISLESEGKGNNANTRAVLNTLDNQLTTSINENQCGGVCCFCERGPAQAQEQYHHEGGDVVSGGGSSSDNVMDMPDPCRHCLNHNIPQGKGWWQRVRAPLYENIVGPIKQVASRVRTPTLLTSSTAPCVYCGFTEVRTQRPTGNAHQSQHQNHGSESELSQLLSLDAPLHTSISHRGVGGGRNTTHNHSVSINNNGIPGSGVSSTTINSGSTSAAAASAQKGIVAVRGSDIPDSVDMGDGCVIKRAKIQPDGSMPHRPRPKVSFSNSDSLLTNANMVPQNQPAIFVRIDFEPLISHYLAQGGNNQAGGANEDDDQSLPRGLKSPLHKVHSDLYEAILHVMRAYGVVVPNSFPSQVPPNGLHVPSQNSEQQATTSNNTKKNANNISSNAGAVSPLGINITQRNIYYKSNPLPPSKPGPSGRQIARVSGVVTNDLAKGSQRYQDYINVFSSANSSTQQLAAWAAMACAMELRSVCVNILRAHIVGFSLATVVPPPTATLPSPNSTVAVPDLIPGSMGSDSARRQSLASIRNPHLAFADASFSGLDDMPTWADQQWSKVMATTQSVKEKIRQGMIRRGVAHSSTSSTRATSRARGGGAGITTWQASLMPTLLVTSIDGGVTYSTASPLSIARANYDASLALDLTHLQQQLDVPLAVTGEVAKISVMGVGKYKKGGGGMAALWLQALVEAGTMPMRGNTSLVIYELVPHAYVGVGISSPTPSSAASVGKTLPQQQQQQVPLGSAGGVTLEGSNNQIFRTSSDLAATNLITSPSLDSNAIVGAAGSGSRATSPHTPRMTVVSILPTDSDPHQHSGINTAINPIQPGPQGMKHLAAHGAACDKMRMGEYEAAIDAFLANATAISTQGIYESDDATTEQAATQPTNHLTPLESALARHGMRLCEVCEELIVTAKCKEIIIHPPSSPTAQPQQKAFLSTRPPLPS